MKKFILIIPLLGFLSCAASYAQVGLDHKTHKKEQKVDKKEAKTEKKHPMTIWVKQ